MIKSVNLFLIGPMGSGKSTIGRLLAKTLNFHFEDSDALVEKHAGADISWIFDKEGEAGFRKREEQVIQELTELSEIVLATGGGVVLSKHNRTLLAARGTVIYLQVSLKEQIDRIAHSKERPLLQTDNPQQVLKKLQKEREPLYHEIADIVIATDNLSPQAIVQEILTKLQTPISLLEDE